MENPQEENVDYVHYAPQYLFINGIKVKQKRHPKSVGKTLRSLFLNMFFSL
jgi:hypothetical protein